VGLTSPPSPHIDAIIVDSLTRDLDVRFLTWANDYGAVRALCNAIHDAVVRP